MNPFEKQQLASELIMSIINIFYLVLLLIQVFILRSVQKFNDIMPERKKIDLKTIYTIPILTIISAIFLSVSISAINDNSFYYSLSVLGILSLLVSYIGLFYCLLYITYQAKKEINKLHCDNKCKWYLDETGFYATIILVLLLLSPTMFILLSGDKINMNSEIRNTFVMIYTAISLYSMIYFYFLKKVRQHLDRVKIAYIPVCAAKEIDQEESKSYQAYLYNKNFEKNNNQ